MTKTDPNSSMVPSKTYPYTRQEECAWETPETVAQHLADLHADNVSPSDLLHQGWTEEQAERLRRTFGSNALKPEEDEKERFCVPWLTPILEALAGQLKEPLILMLLASACLSVALGNAADAVSIAVALTIVAVVAAVQEYRSEQALEKLSHLVPPTATILRNGRVQAHLDARELVLGDVVLLSIGE